MLLLLLLVLLNFTSYIVRSTAKTQKDENTHTKETLIVEQKKKDTMAQL